MKERTWLAPGSPAEFHSDQNEDIRPGQMTCADVFTWFPGFPVNVKPRAFHKKFIKNSGVTYSEKLEKPDAFEEVTGFLEPAAQESA